ncbi:hypothetical protein RND71_042658 [Anisodus tanguticus]|uniref:Helicase C-terminal domain-containing protein n=1 Tax=Anisodus tanguticus TaxID=243964 RepID=A0AAE1USH4_9SOLA|nr:hypothetical protein RND71_042658 [Anisodus tanguticus]
MGKYRVEENTDSGDIRESSGSDKRKIGKRVEDGSMTERTRRRYEGKYFAESPSLLDVDGFRFYDSSAVHDPAIYGEGTVWDLVPLSAKSTMYPHQRSGFEFMWKNIAGDINLEKLREPFENVKEDSLPGIRDTVIHLKPTDLQKELLKKIPEHPGSFYEQNLMSLISVHPSLVAKRNEFSDLESQLKVRECRLDPNTGVKMKFVVELIRLCDGLEERVIIFSQLLDPLTLIKEQLNSLFGWTLGQEILYMDGKLDVKQRQISINFLNDPKSDVKGLLASIKACSEGISLIGASRVVLLDVLWNPSVEQQAISRAYMNGQKKFVHAYCPVTSKWEVDKIEQQTRKKYHSDILLSGNEANACKMNSVSEDTILDAMVQNESIRHMFEKLSHAPRVVPNSCNQPSKPSS